MSKKVTNTNKIAGKVDANKWVEENGYPELGVFTEKKDLQKFYKQLPTEILEDWCQVEGLEVKACEDSEAIHRMRVCMAILYLHFPKAPSTTSKKKSKYADYTTERLIEMAVENDVPVEVTDDMRIMRMRTIMSLRAHQIIE